MIAPFLVIAAALQGSAAAASAARAPSEWHTERTLRFDYYHTGTATEEHIAPDRYRLEGAWPGSWNSLVDRTNLGKYMFEVVDRATNQIVYSRGFSSIYGEWETTGEAKRTWRALHESQRFPEPTSEVQLILKKRAPDGGFREIWVDILDPASRFVDRSPLPESGTVVLMRENGPPSEKVDLLVVAEGYTAEQQDEFLADASRLTGVLFDTEPFERYASDFNVRLLFVPSPDAGIPNPRKAEWPRTSFGLSFNAFDSDRYVLTNENATLREAAAQAPYDALILLFNSKKYGGGGIFNLWATCASDTEPAPYVFVHEFGHSFAGLADEYYSSQVAYEDFVPPGSEPWEPNVTALLDPARLKWRELVDAKTPLPTAWNKAAYDEVDLAYQKVRAEKVAAKASEEEMEVLFRDVKAKTGPMLASDPNFGKVGAFEGAAYQGKGLYRPEVDCIMFTRNPTSFCRVCERAIGRMIGSYTR